MGVAMRAAVLSGTFTLAIIGLIGMASSQYRVGIPELDTVGVGTQTAAIHDDFDDMETTGSIGRAGAARLSLTDEQRGFVFLGVINLPDVPDVDMTPPRLTERLSDAVALYDIPAMVIRRIPEVQGYKFVKLDDRILLVSADSREVVAAIPRYKLVVR
jgi:hypothetical protein